MLRVLIAALVISMVLTGCGKKEDPNATEINPWGLSDDGAILGSGSGSDYMPGDMKFEKSDLMLSLGVSSLLNSEIK